MREPEVVQGRPMAGVEKGLASWASSGGRLPAGQVPRSLTRKLSKKRPELSDVRGKGDVGVQDNDPGQVGRQDGRQHEFH